MLLIYYMSNIITLSEKQMTNNPNIWDYAERNLSIDDSSVYKTFFLYFWYVSIYL
jgi:hypothetical protein